MANYIKIGADWKTIVNYFVHAGCGVVLEYRNDSIVRIENRLVLTREGKFLADGIAAALFVE